MVAERQEAERQVAERQVAERQEAEQQAVCSRAPGRLVCGLGLGWRPPIASYLTRRDDLDFVEVVAESVTCTGPLPAGLAELTDRGLPVITHGVGLSLGGAEALEADRLQLLVDVAGRLSSPLVSEHIAFTRSRGLSAGHLLPVPRTAEALDVLVRHVREAADALPVPLALEHISALLAWPENEMGEAEFLVRLLERTDALLLLDLANLHADAVNFGVDAEGFLDALPLERVAYCHVAGGVAADGLWHDTHAARIEEPVLRLVDELAHRRGPAMPGVLLERDDDWPRATDLDDELDALAERLTARRVGPAAGRR